MLEWGLNEYYVSLVRTGVTIEAPRFGMFFSSNRDPDVLMKAIAAAKPGAQRAESQGGGKS
jgi:hypothetical protein